jgi:membrane-associated phospholipid phosphatase
VAGYTRAPDRWALHLILPVAVIAVSTAVAAGGVPGWEESAFRTVHGLPDVLAPLLWLPMQMGSLFGPGVVAAISWLVWARWRPSVGAVVAGVVGWWLAQVVKEAIERSRPHAILADLDRRAGAPIDGWGFLSGHATVAFALAAVVSPYLGRGARIAAYGLAGSVALARVHVGAHLPLDVVAGAALGYGVGWAWNLSVGVPTERA